jgi:hypothetical protein
MGLAPAGLIKFLLHRQHVDALGFRPGLHHRLDPVLLLLGRWPFKVLPPAARVCPAGPRASSSMRCSSGAWIPAKRNTLSPSLRVAPSRVIKCVKCERSAASAPPAPSADSSPISSRFFIGFIVVSP